MGKSECCINNLNAFDVIKEEQYKFGLCLQSSVWTENVDDATATWKKQSVERTQRTHLVKTILIIISLGV